MAPSTGTLVLVALVALVALLVGAALAFVTARAMGAAQVAALTTERDLLRERCVDLEAALGDDQQTAATLAPLRDALQRVERQVGALERDRQQQFGSLGTQLEHVGAATAALRDQTASLAGALQSSTVRGTWGESHLRRLLEHAGLVARCDFDEQVRAVSSHGAQVRPDAVVRLPGDRVLVIDAKAPMTAFLAAHAEGLSSDQQGAQLRAHSRHLRGHVDTLAGKAYWSAFAQTPELVVCFVPSDAVLVSALDHDPALFDDALAKKVVLTSPATLLALLRTVAFTWQQDALTTHATQLLALGSDLYSRLGTMAGHATRLGGQLTRSVESYNAFVGALESRVLVTARRMHELGLVTEAAPEVSPVDPAPRPLTAVELIEALDADVDHRPEIVDHAADHAPEQLTDRDAGDPPVVRRSAHG